MSSLSWIISHGTKDDYKNFDHLLNQAKFRKLSLTCGNSINFVRHITNSLNIKSRQVSLFAMNNLNHLSDGHVMLEIYDNKYSRWILYDIDNNVIFRDAKGNLMSLIELEDKILSNNYILEKISVDSFIDINSFKIKSFDMHLFYESLLATQEGKKFLRKYLGFQLYSMMEYITAFVN